jgi:hypothetical protein
MFKKVNKTWIDTIYLVFKVKMKDYSQGLLVKRKVFLYKIITLYSKKDN